MDKIRLFRRGAWGSFLGAALLFSSLALTGAVILTARLPSEASPEEVERLAQEYRIPLAAIGLLVVLGGLLAFPAFWGLHGLLGPTRLSLAAAAAGTAASFFVAFYGIGGNPTAFIAPDWIVSNVTDAVLGVALLLVGVAVLLHPSPSRAYGWATVGLGAAMAIAAATPSADPHLAQLSLMGWLIPTGLKLLRGARTGASDAAAGPATSGAGSVP